MLIDAENLLNDDDPALWRPCRIGPIGAELEGVSDIETLNKVLERAVTLRNMMKNRERVDGVAKLIVEHYLSNVEPMGYKAFVVGVDREACSLYKDALDKYLPPEYAEVVISHGHNDPAELRRFHFDETKELEIRKAFRNYVTARIPGDCKVEFGDHSSAPAIALPWDMKALGAAKKALTEEWGKETVLFGSGASIPVVADFKKTLGLDSLLVGFGLDDDNIHSPNEKYDLKSYHKGIRSWARILAALAEAPR